MQYVLVGSGVASVAAAEAIRQVDPEGHILIVGEEKDGYYSRPGLAYYLTGEVPERMLFPFRPEDFRKLRINLLHDRVEGIDPKQGRVYLSQRGWLPYDRLLLAVGARARRPQLPGIDLQGVVYLDTLANARHILHLARRAKRAVVVGGGITALEIVEGLRARGLEVHYLLRGDRYWKQVLSEDESRIVEHRLREDGVHIHYHTEVEEILEKRGCVAGVRTKDGQVIRCEIVAFAIGIRPRIELATDAGLLTDRGILVNEYMETNVPNIYAAGDVAQVYDPQAGTHVLDSLWPVARRQGEAAGYNMAGRRVPYRRGTPLNVTRLAHITTSIMGAVGQRDLDPDAEMVRGDSEVWRVLPDAIVAQKGFDVNRIRLMVGERTLLGAVIMGDQTLSRAVYTLIDRQVDITPIRKQLLRPKVSLGEVLSEFWEAWFREQENLSPQNPA